MSPTLTEPPDVAQELTARYLVPSPEVKQRWRDVASRYQQLAEDVTTPPGCDALTDSGVLAGYMVKVVLQGKQILGELGEQGTVHCHCSHSCKQEEKGRQLAVWLTKHLGASQTYMQAIGIGGLYLPQLKMTLQDVAELVVQDDLGQRPWHCMLCDGPNTAASGEDAPEIVYCSHCDDFAAHLACMRLVPGQVAADGRSFNCMVCGKASKLPDIPSILNSRPHNVVTSHHRGTSASNSHGNNPDSPHVRSRDPRRHQDALQQQQTHAQQVSINTDAALNGAHKRGRPSLLTDDHQAKAPRLDSVVVEQNASPPLSAHNPHALNTAQTGTGHHTSKTHHTPATDNVPRPAHAMRANGLRHPDTSAQLNKPPPPGRSHGTQHHGHHGSNLNSRAAATGRQAHTSGISQDGGVQAAELAAVQEPSVDEEAGMLASICRHPASREFMRANIRLVAAYVQLVEEEHTQGLQGDNLLENEVLREENAALRREISQLKDQQGSLQRQVSELQKKNDHLQRQLQAADQDPT